MCEYVLRKIEVSNKCHILVTRVWSSITIRKLSFRHEVAVALPCYNASLPFLSCLPPYSYPAPCLPPPFILSTLCFFRADTKLPVRVCTVIRGNNKSLLTTWVFVVCHVWIGRNDAYRGSVFMNGTALVAPKCLWKSPMMKKREHVWKGASVTMTETRLVS